MALQPSTTSQGFILPSIHALAPFFTLQSNLQTQAIQTGHWTRLILAYSRHRRLFALSADDIDSAGSEWRDVLGNKRINRRLEQSHLALLMATMVSQNQAVWDPPKQNRTILLYWRQPEEWAEVLYNWVNSTGQLNTILTFYEITEPPIESETKGVPIALLRKVIAILSRTGRAQIIDGSDGAGAKFFAANGKG